MPERREILVKGLVQSVGFRPFVHRLASRFPVSGFVRNHAGGVLIEVQGDRDALDRFAASVLEQAPPLSRIDDVQSRIVAVQSDSGFTIRPSEDDDSLDVLISPDVAMCEDCLAELFDAQDRRHGYPFLNCTNCGPRLTIIQGAPYDRERTTMAAFTMCAACEAEYRDPRHRRFHAEPTACPTCGPQLQLLSPGGEPVESADPLALFRQAILRGEIGALKGIGGFHLVCDARNSAAVGELRRRKRRDARPFAIMVREVQTAAIWCDLSPLERELLQSQRRPIVLLRRRREESPHSTPLAAAVAPDNPYLGVLLPYSPLHQLLMEPLRDVPLVMTSGNHSDEPIVHRDEDVVARVGALVDVILTHDRPIAVRCEDSVTRVVDGRELPVRRSRGVAPEPVRLPFPLSEPVLAVGGQLKGCFALGRGSRAVLSHHLGDLDHLAAFQAFEHDVGLYEQLFHIRPRGIVHDRHPDYAPTRYARQRAEAEGLELHAVQHHHAHLASCLADNGLNETVIGVVFDGTGLGLDDALWGGEFLIGDCGGFERVAHLRYVRLPGGDQAIRQPWRMAVAHALDAGCEPTGLPLVAPTERRIVERMAATGLNAPNTSSVGRLFDAVAALIGLCRTASYEGQAAAQLEWLATDVVATGSYPFELSQDRTADTRPTIQAIVQDVRRGVEPARVARRFHSTVVEIVAAVCKRIRSETELGAVALSGGVFLNALLAHEVYARLTADGFQVYRHRQVPPSDGGLCLGQLAVAAARQAALRPTSADSPAGNDR